MAFREIVETIQFPEGATDRYKRLNALRRMLDGSLFDGILYDFATEQVNGDYISLLKRRPSAPYNIARIVVDQSSGLLWGGEQMPYIECGTPKDEENADGSPNEVGKDKRTQDRANVEAIVTNCVLDAVMMEAYESAAAGSAAIVVRTDKEGNANFEIIPGEEATPIYDPFVPSKMIRLEHVFPTTAKKLRDSGIPIDANEADDTTYWCRIDFTSDAERRYRPLRASDFAILGTERVNTKTGAMEKVEWRPDIDYRHHWGQVPALWCRNLVGGGNGVDGRATYGDVIDIQVEIAYVLSQIGRGYRYAADPLLVRKRGELSSKAISDIDVVGDETPPAEMEGPEGQTVRSASNVLEVGEGGDAKLLEITGNGLKAAGEYVDKLREFALEVVGAMKADASNTKGVSSGRALEMLYQALQLLLKRQRIAFGTRVFLPLIRLLLIGVSKKVIEVDDVENVDAEVRMTLKWPQWLKPRGAELLATVQAWEVAAGGSAMSPVCLIPPERASGALASDLGFTDPNAISKEIKDEIDELKDQQAQHAELDLETKKTSVEQGKTNLEHSKANPPAGPEEQ